MRKLASIQKIRAINPIPNADAIEAATVLDWTVVIKKGEFNVGDLCVFFEVDSLIPRDWWNDFLADKNKPEAPIRLRTIRLRGQLSQGLATDLNVLPENIRLVQEGQDVSEALGITKYEPPVPACLSGKARGRRPSHVPMTDEPRIQSFPHLLDDIMGKDAYWSLKCDGSSASFCNIDDHTPSNMQGGDHHICSRKLSLLETEGNTFWKMYHKYNLKEVLDDAGVVAIQGEVVGPSIQGNRMGLSDHELLVFNVYDIKSGRYIDFVDLCDFCKGYGLKMVPVIQTGVFEVPTVEEVIRMGESATNPNGSLGEGYVIRPVREERASTGERLSFKIINNKYLLKHKE